MNTSQFLEYGANGDYRDQASQLGCTKEETFSKIYAGIQVVNLSLIHISYYLFRRRICEYQERTGIDLMQFCFEQLAGNQVRLLKISGKCVRMDSKLIGSNIARQSRYELIHTCLLYTSHLQE